MKLKHPAVAGTLESSDCRVTIEPTEGDGIQLSLESSVLAQFENELTQSIHETLDKLDVENCKIRVEDQGALDCTVRSRVQTAVFRAADQTKDLPWGTKL